MCGTWQHNVVYMMYNSLSYGIIRQLANQAEADAWSEIVDKHQVSVVQQVFDEFIWNDPMVLTLGGLAVDALADNHTKRTMPYCAQHCSPGAERVDAWAQSWTDLAVYDGELLYINPPWHDMGRVLERLLAERGNAIIAYPSWDRPWQSMWPLLQPKKVIHLPVRNNLLKAEPWTKQLGLVKVHYRVQLAVIHWDS
jgi:hypothetical protein